MKAHRFDPVSFFTGLLIAAIGLVFLIPSSPADIIETFSAVAGWVWPVLILVLGIVVLVPVLLPSGRKDQDQSKSIG